jgi:hypothetical protein
MIEFLMGGKIYRYSGWERRHYELMGSVGLRLGGVDMSLAYLGK